MDQIAEHITTHTDRGVPFGDSFTDEYAIIPMHIRAALMNYVGEGVAPGHGVRNILCDRLSCILATDDIASLRAVVLWIHNNLPGLAWGSDQAVADWCKNHPKRRQPAAV